MADRNLHWLVAQPCFLSKYPNMDSGVEADLPLR
jgi:hypothetical protein